MNRVGPIRLLHVEDNPLDADLARRALTGAGVLCEIDVACTLAEARARLDSGAGYDAVLTDLHLPDGHGLDLILEIRARGLPAAVVALTSQGDENVVLAALRAGADDYLAKNEELPQRLPNTLRAAMRRFKEDAARHARVLNVLYAEHDALDLDLTRRQFDRCASNLRLHAVADAASVLSALAAGTAQGAPFDVLLLDYRLPAENGLDVLKVVREDRELDLPVVVVTGQGSEDIAAQAMRLGATDYVVKREGYLEALPIVIENAFHRVNAVREQAALRRSEERLALVLRGSNDAPWDVDLVGGERYLSPRFWQMLGFEGAPPGVGADWLRERLHPDEQVALAQQFTDALLGHGDAFEQELRACHRDGHFVPILARGFISRDASGRACRISGTCTDLTERKRAEARIHELNATLERRVAARTRELQQANQELEAFSYSVSHDLRAPLRAVDALAAMLAQEHAAALGGEGLKKLQLLRDSAAKMNRLIHDLLAFSRAGRTEPQRTSVPTAALVRHSLEEFRGEIDARGIRVEVGDLPPCEADLNLLRQVFVNLLANAVKYTSRQRQPEIHVDARTDNTGATVFCVRDNGAGFDMAHAAKLFTVFSRLHNDAEFEGTGVGLAIVHRIVQRHGGRVWAEGSPGRGAAFYFTLGTEPGA
jgi:PAS domain S-box-containing protein